MSLKSTLILLLLHFFLKNNNLYASRNVDLAVNKSHCYGNEYILNLQVCGNTQSNQICTLSLLQMSLYVQFNTRNKYW